MNQDLIRQQTRAFIASMKEEHLTEFDGCDEDTKSDMSIDLGGQMMDLISDEFKVNSLCFRCASEDL